MNSTAPLSQWVVQTVMRLIQGTQLPLAIIVWAICGAAAAGDDPKPSDRTKPQLAPLPRNVRAPADNPTTADKVELGKQLFFDPRLSGDNTMSCASCHLPEKAWGDGLPTAKGYAGKMLDRNTPTVLNVALLDRLFWDGRAASLEQQALVPIEAPNEMHQDLDKLIDELNGVPGYVRQFEAVFGTRADRETIAKSLAAFQRTLLTGPAPVDRFLAGDEDELSAAAKRGMELFVTDADCIRCHHGPLLSDGKFYRLGVSFRDRGLGGVTGNKLDDFKFRTPPLRNISQTGPYMHNGSLKTLTEVVTFYFREVPDSAPGRLPLDVRPLTDQSFSDISDIVAFLESLTGTPAVVETPKLPQ